MDPLVLPQGDVAAGGRVAQHGEATAPGQELAVEGVQGLVLTLLVQRQIELRPLEGVDVLGIRRRLAHSQAGKLGLPPGAYRLDQVWVIMIGEVEEGVRLAVLLAHEEERDEGREEDGGRGQFPLGQGEEVGEPFAAGTVADLVVVLGEDDELVSPGRRRRATKAAPAR